MSRMIDPIRTNYDFEVSYAGLAERLLRTEPFDRGEVHAQKTTTPDMHMHELIGVGLRMEVPVHSSALQPLVMPNLPWAEDHFQERICGEALNPPPSNEWWPFAQAGNEVHKKDQLFSHTYPERFWPKRAGHMGQTLDFERMGIRFPYGDLNDVIEILRRNPRSRQAYLPIWFPEDLGAAAQGERVPCTLGYHFMLNPQTRYLDMFYPMRSCDIVRFFRDDVYMAGRLLQHVAQQVDLDPGFLNMQINNLHCFAGDRVWLSGVVEKQRKADRRQSYDFGALM